MKTTRYFDATRERQDRASIEMSWIESVIRQGIHAMKIRYFEDTDTLLIELKVGSVAETRDLDDDTLLDLDAQGQALAITLEHATQRAELSSFSFDRVTA